MGEVNAFSISFSPSSSALFLGADHHGHATIARAPRRRQATPANQLCKEQCKEALKIFQDSLFSLPHQAMRIKVSSPTTVNPLGPSPNSSSTVFFWCEKNIAHLWAGCVAF